MAGTVGRWDRRAGFPTALAGDDLVAAAGNRPDHDGLHHAHGLDGRSQFVERGRIERRGARLIRIAVELVERDMVDLVGVGPGSGRRRDGSVRNVSRGKQRL